ncbi:pectate lyase family protein [Actinokineospora sp. 24-640]
MNLVKRRVSRRMAAVTAVSTVAAVTTGLVMVGGTASAAPGCRVNYTVADQWGGGFGANVTVTNLGDAITGGWTLEWDFTGGQTVQQGWNGVFSQSGTRVRVTNPEWGSGMGTGASMTPGFTGTWAGSNPAPTTFRLNGTVCTGGVVPTTTSTTRTTTTTTTTTGNPPAPGGLAGWATQNGGTTGGGSASPVTVSSASALTSALGSSSAAVIRVSGTISCSGMLRVRSNKTILGNSGATIVGCGFTVNGDRNVIIRNLSFRDWADDAINIETGATNVWVDHNSFTNGYDGAVDIKRGSDFITVSWNRVFGHDKSMLLGHSDDNASQDVGHLRVSYHHNYFDGSGTRHPRVRFGNPVHVYNNYYRDNEYGVASTMNAGVLVEGNYFENVDEPTLVGYADSDPGAIVQRNNVFVGSGTPQSGGGTVAPIPYQYTLDSASTVKASVSAGAGAGKISV